MNIRDSMDYMAQSGHIIIGLALEVRHPASQQALVHIPNNASK